VSFSLVNESHGIIINSSNIEESLLLNMDKVNEARYRRRLRVEKIRALRCRIKPHKLSSNNNNPFVVSIPMEFHLPQTKEDESTSNNNNVYKDRKVRNRESAFNSRKRKSDEMLHLQQRVVSLEDEVRFLKDKLQKYEKYEKPLPTVLDTRNSTASTATTTTSMTTTTTRPGKIPNMMKIPTSNVDLQYIHLQQQQYNNNCNTPLEPAVFKI